MKWVVADNDDPCPGPGCGGRFTHRAHGSPYINCFRCGEAASFAPHFRYFKLAQGMELRFFWKQQCAPCERLKPVAIEAAEKTGVPIVFIEALRDDPTTSELLERYQIRQVPSLVLVDAQGTRLKGWYGNMINIHAITAAIAAKAAKPEA